MAHHKSAKKRIRRNARRTEINRDRIGRVRSFVKKVELAIAGGDQDAAQAALRAAQPELHRGANRGVLHRNPAARKIARLNARVKAMGSAAKA
jgi:small subunit ribosomal protein S20